MADDARTAGREPWWARTRETEDAPPGGEEPGTSAPAGGSAPWLGQTEPFLRALERSLDPLEDKLGRIADAARANHTEMERLGGETHEGLQAVTEALAEARSTFASSADAVRARADATAQMIERAGGEVERLAGLLAETEQRITAAGTANREATEGHVAAAVEQLTGSLAATVAAAEGRLAESQAAAAQSLDRVGAEVARLAGLLAATEERLTSAAAADREASEQRLTTAITDAEGRLAEGQATAAQSLEQAVRESRAELGTEVREATESATQRIGAGTERLAGQVAAVSASVERLPTREDVAAVQAATVALETVVREADAQVAEHVTRSTGELDVKLRTALRDTADESAAQVAAVQAGVEEAAERLPVLLDGLRDELAAHQDRSAAQLAQQVATSVAALDQGLKRIERLGDLIEAMATKRGFQELVQSETELREEQAAFVTSLTDASTHVEEQVAVVTGHANDLAQRLEAAARDAAALRQVPPQTAELVAGTMTEASERLDRALRSTFAEDVARTTAELRRELEAGVPVAEVLEKLDGLASTQAEVTAAHGEVAAVAGTVGEAAAELRQRMEGWGEARSVPHLAEELAALDERVRRIEQYVADDLAAALSELVSQQVVQALDERDAERPKGIFRRT